MKWSRRAAGGLAWACRLRPLPLPQRGCPPPSAFPPSELAVPLAVSGSAALEFLVALVTRDIYYLRILPVSSRLLDPSLPPGGEMRAPFPWSKRSRGPQPGADLPLAHPGSALSPGWPGAPLHLGTRFPEDVTTFPMTAGRDSPEDTDGYGCHGRSLVCLDGASVQNMPVLTLQTKAVSLVHPNSCLTSLLQVGV